MTSRNVKSSMMITRNDGRPNKDYDHSDKSHEDFNDNDDDNDKHAGICTDNI